MYGDVATVTDVETSSSCIVNAILRGKRLPGIGSDQAGGAWSLINGEGSRLIDAAESPGVSGSSGGRPEREGGPAGGEGPRSGEAGGEGECVYEVALSVSLRQQEAFPHPVSNVWAGSVMVLLHEWMVNRGEFAAAEGYVFFVTGGGRGKGGIGNCAERGGRGGVRLMNLSTARDFVCTFCFVVAREFDA